MGVLRLDSPKAAAEQPQTRWTYNANMFKPAAETIDAGLNWWAVAPTRNTGVGLVDVDPAPIFNDARAQADAALEVRMVKGLDRPGFANYSRAARLQHSKTDTLSPIDHCTKMQKLQKQYGDKGDEKRNEQQIGLDDAGIIYNLVGRPGAHG
ncbi:hypothetical protein FZEAL_4435 [Fusarium zealandicum]|uniref:Uncharacterized protein n=1 Tax=Fusarium zealandicum TaxID=1053134 RepID=A0A8H4XLW8_9HYPO|nr:hypothetical protein FZEAL_4435 [Fusarium zealandicum]